MNVTQLLSICFGLWLGLSSMPSVAAATAGSTWRYLFLIDSSQTVAQDKDAIAEAVAARLRTGFDGRMGAGELFAVWTFGGNTVSTDDYLPTPWQPRTSQLLSERLARSLKDLPFQGEARLDKAIAEVMKRLPVSDSLTVVIVCSGSSMVVGTPFDDRINASFRQPLETTGTPAGVYMTTLLIHRGEMIGWLVQPVPGTVSRLATRVEPPQPARRLQPEFGFLPASGSLPERSDTARSGRGDLPLVLGPAPQLMAPVKKVELSAPRKAETSKTEVTAEPTETIDPIEPKSTAVSHESKSRAALSNSTGTGSASPTEAVPAPSLPIIPPRPVAVPPPPISTETQELSAAPAPLPKPVRVIAKAPEPQPVPAHSALIESAPESALAAPQAGAAVSPPARPNPINYLALGVGLLVTALLGMFCFARSKREEKPSSLISRSLDARK